MARSGLPLQTPADEGPRNESRVRGTIQGRERASHHGIGGNLKRAELVVNDYVLMQMQIGCKRVRRYLSLQNAGSIGEDVAEVPALHSTKTVRRLEFGLAGFTALTMGAQAGGKWNRSLRASSDRETSSANS